MEKCSLIRYNSHGASLGYTVMGNDRFSVVLLISACLAAVFGVWMSPERFAETGLMQASLTSANPMVQLTAQVELAAARATVLVLAAVLFGLGVCWQRLEAARPYRQFLAADRSFGARYEAALPRFVAREPVLLLAVIVAAMAYMGLGDRLLSLEARVWINREDGFLETATAVMLLLAGALAARVALAHGAALRVRLMHGFLVFLFLFMAGEEISWGQRILGFRTPEALAAVNVQNEANLHNTYGYVFDHLFILCFFVWGCVVPVLNRASRFFAQVFRATGLPIPSAGLAVGMLFITLTREQVTESLGLGVSTLRVAELRECLSAVTFLALMAQSLRGLVPRRVPGAGTLPLNVPAE